MNTVESLVSVITLLLNIGTCSLLLFLMEEGDVELQELGKDDVEMKLESGEGQVIKCTNSV